MKTTAILAILTNKIPTKRIVPRVCLVDFVIGKPRGKQNIKKLRRKKEFKIFSRLSELLLKGICLS